VALNLLIFELWRSMRVTRTPVADAPAMLWLANLQPVASRPEPFPERPSRTAVRQPIAPLPRAEPLAVAPSQASTAITLPPVDWEAEARRAGQRMAQAAEAPVPESRLDSRPKVLELPQRGSASPRAGDVVHLEGGVMNTWLNQRCFMRSGQPGPTLQGATLSLPTCKVRSMKERASEEIVESLARDLAPKLPGYMTVPLPMPAGPTAGAGR
jgi:hypothetical protein